MIRLWTFTFTLLILGAGGGEVARLLGLPLPWMIGGLATTALLATFAPGRIPPGYVFSMRVRRAFIAIIGAMIGAQVDAALLAQWRSMSTSLAAVAAFVVLAHAMNYVLFRRAGGYDRPTAFFCATPGGLVESLTMGEQAGADLRVLTVQQFLRIVLVVTLVPLGLSILHGSALGSAAGLSLTRGEAHLSSIAPLMAVATAGLALGGLLRLPAGQLTGPLIVSALVAYFGWVELAPPAWVVATAQVVIGVSLGVRFIGVTGRMLRRGLSLAVVSVGGMLVLATVLATGVSRMTGQSIEVLVLSFSPGGVTEMGLVALSLSANPAMVALHHLFRITLTVLEMAFLWRWLRPDPPDSPDSSDAD